MTTAPPDIPGYTLHGLLGRGGMAEVWLATQNSLRRKVAIKVLLSADDDHFNQRFIKEGHLVASLHHPAIITIHDIDRLPDGRYYLAMEFVGGGDLAQFKGQVFAPERALAILRQIAEGLDVVHGKGLIHRDLKPANILFRDAERVVISDFGIAKDLRIDSELTQDGIVVGSPAYSSPEQAQCLAVDARTDLYSLGVMLLEMLTGRNPFRGDSYAQTVANHLHMPPPRLPDSLKNCQPLLDRLLAKDPAERFADCRALLAALDRLEPSPASRPAWRAAWRDRPRPVRMAILGAGMAGLLALAAPGIMRQVSLWHHLQQAGQRLAEGRLIAPAADNADFHYREALRIDPDNADAREGLVKVRDARIRQWLALAERRFAENRLFQPANDNAVHYYRQALTLAPQQPLARAGLHRVAEACRGLAEAAIARRDTGQARELVRQGLDAEPGNASLQALAKSLADTPRSDRNARSGKKSATRPASPLKKFLHKLFGN
jgi:tetratricopeptide (TPR) repeat protein